MAATDQLLDQLPRTTTFDAEDLLFVSHAGTAYATPAATFKGEPGEPGVSPEVDEEPTAGSENAVQSGGVYTALAGKQDALTFDTAPAAGSTNPVTSGGVYSALEETAEELAEDLADLNSPQAASGSVVTFTSDAAGNPVNPLIVNIEPVQSGNGDPSPENIRPITGWTGATVTRTGKNLFDNVFTQGTINAEGEDASTTGERYRTGFIRVSPEKTYVFSQNPAIWGVSAFYYSFSKVFIKTEAWYSGRPMTLPSDCAYIRFVVDRAVSGRDYQLEEGTQSTTIVPYQGESVAISFGSAGTVYGGTLDVARGLLTVDRFSVDAGTLSWTKWTGGCFYSDTSLNAQIPNKKIGAMLCSCYPYSTLNYTTAPDKCVLERSAATTLIYIKDTDYFASETGAAELKSSLSGETIVYQIAPVTYHVNPQEIRTLLGTNNLWADCGDVSATYRTGTESPVMTADDIGVAGGAASYSDYAALEARVAALEQALANS